MKNYLMSSLAIVGAVSLIIMACSADNSNNQNSTANTNAVGKYQISTIGNGFHVINTETGVIKTYVPSTLNTNTSGTYFVYATTTANH